jgi:hypothetical protein
MYEFEIRFSRPNRIRLGEWRTPPSDPPLSPGYSLCRGRRAQIRNTEGPMQRHFASKRRSSCGAGLSALISFLSLKFVRWICDAPGQGSRSVVGRLIKGQRMRIRLGMARRARVLALSRSRQVRAKAPMVSSAVSGTSRRKPGSEEHRSLPSFLGRFKNSKFRAK